MADDVLRRNLQLALDPGPVFPDPSLLARTMAAVAAEAAGVAGRRPEWRGIEWTRNRGLNRLIAVAAMLVLLLGAFGAFVAVSRYASQLIPAHLHPRAGSCSTNGFPRMVSAAAGWNGPSVTSDGGGTWRDVPPPGLPAISTGVGAAMCALDAQHAWMTWPAGTSEGGADHLLLFMTSDGGRSWLQQATFPFNDVNGSAMLEFIDPRNGWLLTDSTGERTFYATQDGGGTWTRISAALPATAPLEIDALGCALTGMTFLNPQRGWITWDCSRAPGAGSPTVGPQRGVGTIDTSRVVIVSNDGGRTWSNLDLPDLSGGSGEQCAAEAPVFTNDSGVMVLNCNGITGSAVYDTSDGGATWARYAGPANSVPLAQIRFGDAYSGYALLADSGSNDLYLTHDGGRHWSVVARGLFVDQNIVNVQFVDASTGFVFTETSGTTPWLTQDGGRSWRFAGPQHTVSNQVACIGFPSDASPGGAPMPVAMFGDVVWAQGALRSSDGGLHWTRVAPPSVPDRFLGTVEYYLDANHAWVAEAAGSDSACVDHIVVFGTADGGKTWQQSDAVPVPVMTPNDELWMSDSGAAGRINPIGGVWLDFADPLHGWVVPVERRMSFDGPQRYGSTYGTTDGGLHWSVVNSTTPAGHCGGSAAIRFSSPSTGWASSYCASDRTSFYEVTHDGGVTWASQDLPCCHPGAPVFFDAMHGLALGTDDQTGNRVEIVTADGGVNWAVRNMTGITEYPFEITFVDPVHGWALTHTVTNTPVTMWRTVDGGATWAAINRNVPGAGYDGNFALVLSNSGVGLISTGSALYRTTDGGHTWVAV